MPDFEKLALQAGVGLVVFVGGTLTVKAIEKTDFWKNVEETIEK